MKVQYKQNKTEIYVLSGKKERKKKKPGEYLWNLGLDKKVLDCMPKYDS